MKPDFNFKYYKELRLLSLIIGLYFGIEFLINLAIDLLEAQGLKYYRFYPAAFILAVIFNILNRNLHRIPWLWSLLIKVPLLRGTYDGQVMFTYDNKVRSKICTLVVHQTTSDISVNCYFWDEDKDKKKVPTSMTESVSLVEDIVEKKNGQYQLLFYYRQKGNFDGTIPIREGFNILTLKEIEGKKYLDGGYFAKNSHSKGNGGNLKVSFKTKKVNHI